MDWQRKAKLLNDALGPDILDSKIVEKGQKQAQLTGIACSGGADSLALLLLLKARLGKLATSMKVLHYHHRTRGIASDEDAEFVQTVASALQLKCHIRTAVTAQKSEHALRESRLAFFRESRLKFLFQAHQADDVAETLLMRLFRGSSVEGLSAPRALQTHGDLRILRPLLHVRASTLRTALRHLGIPFRVDTSNQNTSFLRNKIRHRLSDKIQEVFGPNYIQALARTKAYLEEDADALRTLAATFPPWEAGGAFPIEAYRTAPKAILRRRLWEWFSQVGQKPSARLLDQLLLASAQSGSFTLSGKAGCFVAEAGRLLFQKNRKAESFLPHKLSPPFSLYLPGQRLLRAELIKLQAAQKTQLKARKLDNAKEAFLKPDCLGSSQLLTIRCRRAGDRHSPLGLGGRRKLSDSFINCKIKAEYRDSLPIICNQAEEILWVPHLPIAQVAQVPPQTSKALLLKWQEGK